MISDDPPREDFGAIKVLLWLYFWLVLLEGALRKWIFPQWSDVIFVIRDPLVVAIYLLAWRAQVFPARVAVVTLGVMAGLSLAFTLTTDSPPLVTFFGLRTNYLHPPLAFVMSRVLDRSDVLRFGRWTLLAAVPIIYLMWRQSDAPSNHWLNAGVSGTEGGQIRGAMDRIRPPGPFSFISGVVYFFALASAYVFYGWMHRGAFPRWLIWLGTAAVAAAVPISISRSLLFVMLVVAAFGLVAVARDLRRIPAYLGPILAVVAVLGLAADTIYVEAYRTRWEESLDAGGGGFSSNVVSRMLDEFTQPFEVASRAPLFGHGVGMGTLAGARLTTGEYTFLLAESELARMVLELGPMLGFAFIAWRAWMAISVVWSAWRHYLDRHDSLAWLLAGASFLNVLNGQWGPSTNLGFAIFGAGLSLAALNEPPEDAEGEEEDGEEDEDADEEDGEEEAQSTDEE